MFMLNENDVKLKPELKMHRIQATDGGGRMRETEQVEVEMVLIWM